ncbi:MAG TPA: hypothetical protein VGO58_10625 [Chitinophagaceae bacterium]|nr:hypothetical protein [Chitinophagaceae bacterium]
MILPRLLLLLSLIISNNSFSQKYPAYEAGSEQVLDSVGNIQINIGHWIVSHLMHNETIINYHYILDTVNKVLFQSIYESRSDESYYTHTKKAIFYFSDNKLIKIVFRNYKDSSLLNSGTYYFDNTGKKVSQSGEITPRTIKNWDAGYIQEQVEEFQRGFAGIINMLMTRRKEN